MTAVSTYSPGAALGPAGTLAHRLISGLQRGYLDDRPAAVAALARLRRGAGKDPMAVPDLWGLIDTTSLYEGGLSERERTQAENALYVTLPLWALHQQSRSSGMHVSGRDLGAAVRALMPPGELDGPTLKRFVAAGAASTLPVLANRLRGLALLMRQQDVGLDYARLTEQLCRWQRPAGRDTVRRAWGRSFHTRTSTSTAAKNDGTDTKDAE